MEWEPTIFIMPGGNPTQEKIDNAVKEARERRPNRSGGSLFYYPPPLNKCLFPDELNEIDWRRL